jgi:hypothetical protein
MQDIRKAETAALANTTTTEFILVQNRAGSYQLIIKTASGNAGTIQFGISKKGSAPALTNAFAYGASQTITLTVNRNESLWAKASAGTQNFLVEY